MRIRKRAVPYPLSSLLPGPISDPLINLNRPPPPVVQLHHGGPSSAAPDRPIGQGSSPTDGRDFSDKGFSELLLQEEEGEKKKKKNKSNDNNTRNDNHNISSSAQPAVSASASPDQVLVPPKKRRGSFATASSAAAAATPADGEKSSVVATKRGRGRGGAAMEGSRCSRVNGRGWRCCQQTLVGYSLCEHHLGKGRLRSITAVRNSSRPPSPPPPPSKPNLSATEKSVDDGEVKGKKTRTKLGTVKARSISSLLGQTNAGATFTNEDNVFMSS